MKIKKYIYAAVSLLVAGAVLSAVPVLADEGNQPQGPGNPFVRMWNSMFERGRPMMSQLVIEGTVSGVSGNTVTVNGHQGFANGTTTTAFSVDVTNAKIVKGNSTTTVSSILVGDSVVVQGNINGSSVTALLFIDGKITAHPKGEKDKQGQGDQEGPKGEDKGHASTTPIFGSGQPIIGGTISAVSGNSVTITNKSNVSYTVDASSAVIFQGKATTTVSSLKVGDSIVVQGTVNGSAVVATSILDQAKPAPKANDEGMMHKLFGGIGNLFGRIFGF